ncbi:acyl carrier protein [Ralstonia solanacearum species complex bacterium KE056]|uniref:acyl carrier protein n=1 Tax=Ralstonia solanacearum species complex bacterium KE056 TaxID=3119585 RepID=UPI0001D93BBB|nr:putative phosphopantetheine-binding and acyl carrier protein [Ralstonia solanacearum CMR15]
MNNLITDPPQLAAEVRAIAAEVLEIGTDAVDTGKSLRDQGLDSLKLLFLIDALESRFDVRLVGENLGPNDFRSVDSICRLLGDDHADHA